MVKQNNLKEWRNTLFKAFFTLCGFIAASMIVFIFFFIFIKGISVFLPNYGTGKLNLVSFLTGLRWQANEGAYGVLFIVINTLTSSFFAILISFPLSVLTALYIVKMAPKRISKVLETVIELLAAIPSIVYGLFASGFIVILVDKMALTLGMSTFGGRSLLSVSLLLAFMIFPTIASISMSAIKSVDKDLEKASLALGASEIQTYFKVVLVSAKSGIFSGLILGLSRALGEATAVSMVAGNKISGPTLNPFDITRTLTSTIMSGLNETTGVDYDVRFSVGIILMVLIVFSNLIIHLVKRKVGRHAT